MNKKSIAFQLGIYVLTIVMIVMLVVVVLNYTFSRNIITQNVQVSAKQQGTLITNEVTQSILTAQYVSNNVAKQTEFYNSHGNLDLFYKQVIRTNPTIKALYLESYGENVELFSIIRVSENEFDVTTNGFDGELNDELINLKKNVTETGVASWSDPFFCVYDSVEMVSVYAQPILSSNGDLEKILYAQISLNFLKEIILDIENNSDWKVFIINDDGTFITHPESTYTLNETVYSQGEDLVPEELDLSTLLNNTRESYSGSIFPKINNNKKSWVYYSPINNTNWYAVILAPTKSLYRDLNIILYRSILFAMFGMLVVLLVIILLFRKMFHPLSSVVNSIQNFSFEGRKTRKNKNEVDLLNDSLKELQLKYKIVVEEQEQTKKERKKYEKDLRSAKEIQTAIIPSTYPAFPDRPDIELYASLMPAESIGGDLYDYFFIDSNHILFTMGDVSGKGIPAALFMAVAHTLIKSKATFLSPKHIMEQVNNELSFQNYGQNFLTLFLGILDTETGVLSYCNAAHNYPYLIRKNADIIITMDTSHGLPLGLYPNKSYNADSIVLGKGDKIVLYTDGVTDNKNASAEFYGMEKLSRDIEKLKNKSAQSIVDHLLDALDAHRGNAPQADDISILVLEYKGKRS